jgi:hypothetical protein
MKYRVDVSGVSRAHPAMAKPVHVELTVEAQHDSEVIGKAIAYLDRVYPACSWHAEVAQLIEQPAKPTMVRLPIRRPRR